MPTGRRFLSTATADGKIYVFGGKEQVPGPSGDTVEAYDPQTNTWTPKRPMTTPRHTVATATVDGKIYLFGGVFKDGPGTCSFPPKT